MLHFDWSSLILFSGITNAAIAIFLLFKKNKQFLEYSIWVIFILIFMSLIIAERIIRFSGMEKDFPEILFTTSPLFFFTLPFMYCFQKKLSGLPKLYYLHFIIPFLFLILFLPTITLNSVDKLEMYRTKGINDPFWIIGFYIIYVIYYTVQIFFINKKHASFLLNLYADNDIEYQLFSNRILLISGFLTVSIPIALSIQYFKINNTTSDIIERLLFIIFSIAPHMILVSLFKNREEKYIRRPPVKVETINPIETEEFSILKSELLIFMENNKPYVDKELSLQNLAGQLNWNRSSLSQLINKGFNKNFYDFINEYRLNMVLEEFEKGSHKTFSLDHIVGKSGFKSYVTFYRFFRRHKQISPKAYLKTLES